MKCPQCEQPFANAMAVVRHRQTAHHNILHPCRCSLCHELFPTWRERQQHIKEFHEPQDGESETEGSEESTSEDVSVLPAARSLYESKGKDRASKKHPSHEARLKDKARRRTVRRVIVGNRTPHTLCGICLRKFRKKSSLDQHREATGHVTLLLEQSRYNKIQCQPVD